MPANNAPGGAPEISGTATVGETLTADTNGITDADGLDGVAYEYQWFRVEDGAETDIAGATSNTYVLTAADRGAKIKLQVKFRDDLHVEGQEPESLTSPPYPKRGTAPCPTPPTRP